MKTLLCILVALVAFSASAGKSVKGYVTKRGTYVAPYYRTSPNRTRLDNYSSQYNVNPYTGKTGTVDPLKPKPLTTGKKW